FAPFGLRESDVGGRALDFHPVDGRTESGEIEDETGHTNMGRPRAAPVKRAETSIATSGPSTLPEDAAGDPPRASSFSRRRTQCASAATPKNSFTSRSAEARLSEACTELRPLDSA